VRTAAEWGWLGRYAPDSSHPLGKHGSGGAVRRERGRVPGRESVTWSWPPWAVRNWMGHVPLVVIRSGHSWAD